MTGGWKKRALIATAVLALGAAFSVPAASADTNAIIAPSDPDDPQPDSGWQAGTCNFDTPTCDVDSPSAQFFETAGGHPPVGFTQFIVEHEPGLVGGEEPIGALKHVRVDLPPGLTVNPQATEQCTQAEFESDPASECPGAAVGTSFVTGAALGVPSPIPLSETVYNIVPPFGEPARFGFNLGGNNIYLKADVSWEGDFHEGFTIDVPEVPLIGELILKNRLVFDGTSGDGTFITTPTTCLGEAISSSPFKNVYSTWLLASSIAEEESPGYDFPADAQPPLESRIPPGTSPKDCGSVPYDPSISVDPGTSNTDSPAGASVDVELPEVKGAGNQSTSHTRSARVTLPQGMGLNPSAANGLEVCSDAQFGKGTRNPVQCLAASRIGTVEIDTPPLPDGSIDGPVYVGRQLSRDPASGDLYRIFVNAKSDRYGIDARLLGKVKADPRSGQLTTVFDDGVLGGTKLPGLPQVPFESFRIKLDGGPTATLTSPPTCGPNTARTEMTPWSSAQGLVPPGGEDGPSGDTSVTASSGFSLTGAPGGGACASTLGERPFAPDFGAGVDSPAAGAYSPLHMEIARADGNQELKGVDVTLPPGLTAKLKGVSYCPEGSIAAAAANGGEAEASSSSCPASSQIGSAQVAAGSGPSPISIGGKVFLAGPYDGAPLSLAVITPATAGPFDLGTVVVRVALLVDPRTTQVTAKSDPIPHVYGGATLDLRSVAVRLDRPDFSRNPTNCSPFDFGGSLLGGGANPLDPAAFSATAVSAPYQAAGCEQLGFRPKLFLRLFGARKRGKNPKLRAVLIPRKGDANIARAATILPPSLILDQGNLAKVCTRVQYAAGNCPRNSIYGYARAFSPLLDEPLQGPVYLRSSDNTLPDLVSSLRGQVDVELSSRTDSVRGRIRNIFDIVPDVPVSKFILTLRGGRRGLLVNSRDQCPRKKRARKGAKRSDAAISKKKGRKGKSRRRAQRVIVRFKGRNGKKRNLRLRLRVPCAQKRHRGKHRHVGRNSLRRLVRPTLSVLIVAWNSRAELARSLPALLPELGDGDELIVVDNDSSDGTPEAVAELAPAARVVRSGRNAGFAGGCNEGAAQARGDLLAILNPDAAPRPGWGEAIRRPWVEGRGWAAWQALVADGDGRAINSAGNPVHFTGIVWAGGHGRPLGDAPPAGEVPALSGACLAIPRRTWEDAGGFPGDFFLYHEDVDLSLRLRLAGGALGIEPAAVVDHDYEFGAREHKWRWLERNRHAFLLRAYPASLLILLAPALLVTELALYAVAIRGGWGRQKLAAHGEAIAWLPRLLRERRQIQATRTVSSAQFASWLTPDLDSPFIPPITRSFPVRQLLRMYWHVVRLLLKGLSR